MRGIDFGDRVLVQVPDGLRFWPPDAVAMIREEHGRRLEVTSASGEVGHRPGPLAAFAFAPLGVAAPGVLLNPRHVRRRGEQWVVPGGWKIPHRGPLESLPQAPRREEKPLADVGPREAPVTDLLPSEVVCVRRHSPADVQWHTDRGPIPAGLRNLKRVAAAHPGLVRILMSLYVNPARISAIMFVPGHHGRGTTGYYRLVLDDGQDARIERNVQAGVRQRLGLPSLGDLDLEDLTSVYLYREGLRDWPFDLATAPGAVLKRHFGTDERRLISNVIWQVYRQRRNGREHGFGRSHRAFWYRPLVGILARAGLVLPRHIEWEALIPVDPHWLLFELCLERMVGEYRFFDYKALGFEDRRPDLRSIGGGLPHVIVPVEKETLADGVEALRAAHDPTTVILGGQSSYVVTEFLVDALRAAGVDGPLIVVGYVDYDPWGHGIVTGFIEHLRRYGMEVAAVGWLVTPRRFTTKEIAMHAVKVVVSAKNHRSRLANWLRITGGVNGKALGLYADLLRPPKRVVDAFDTVLRELDGAAESKP